MPTSLAVLLPPDRFNLSKPIKPKPDLLVEVRKLLRREIARKTFALALDAGEITEPLWTRAQCASYLQVDVKTLYVMCTTRGFPQPICLGKGPSSERWPPQEVRDWTLRLRP